MNEVRIEDSEILEKLRAPKLGVQTLPIAFAALEKFDAVIDTRSPAEFAEDHLPDAINCPVLDNEQRIQVGTVYRYDSRYCAQQCQRRVFLHRRRRFVCTVCRPVCVVRYQAPDN